MLTAKLLKPRLATIVGSGELAAQQIQKLIKIFSLKKDAEVAYTLALEVVNKQIDQYLDAKTGFLTDMMMNFQSYLATIHQNKLILVQGYIHEVIDNLIAQKPYRINQMFINRVNNQQSKIQQTVNNIKNISKKLKQVSSETYISNEKMKQKLSQMEPKEKKALEERFKNILQSPESIIEQVNGQLDFLTNLSAAYNETTTILVRQETKFLQTKANNVFDNLMRVFILELSFMKSTEFDVNSILKKIKDQQETNRKVALQEFKNTTKQESQKFYLTKYFWDKYKQFTKFNFSISDSMLPNELQHKWNQAMNIFNPYLTE